MLIGGKSMPTMQSTPYRWPWNGLFDMRDFALVVTSAMVANQDSGRITQNGRNQVRDFANTVRQAGALVVEVACSDPRITGVPWRTNDKFALSAGERFTDADIHI